MNDWDLLSDEALFLFEMMLLFFGYCEGCNESTAPSGGGCACHRNSG